MGSHYVPQRYLRGFSDPATPSLVCMFDKKTEVFRNVSIKRVAQEAGFYSDEDERELNNRVEIPGNNAIQSLSNGEELDDKGRVDLAFYIATMIYRVPRHRQRLEEAKPHVLKNVIDEVKGEIQDSGVGDQMIADRLAELNDVEQRFKEALPSSLINEIQRPWPSALTVTYVFNMAWRFVKSDGPCFFLTGDNPAYYFSSLGLGRREAELTFPLSRSLALLGSWTRIRGPNKPISDQRLVREVNRRVASGATRFLFYWREESFVRTLGTKTNPHLSIIPWERMRTV